MPVSYTHLDVYKRQAERVLLGALVRVKPGARIPRTRRVVLGSCAVTQAAVTGGSIAVDKSSCDPLFAGTIYDTGTLEFELTAISGNTTLARIIHAG